VVTSLAETLHTDFGMKFPIGEEGKEGKEDFDKLNPAGRE